MFTLSTAITGNGSVSSADGINCTGSPQGGVCSQSYMADSRATLAISTINSVFSGWGGDCSGCGSALTCSIVVHSPKVCYAVFVNPSPVILVGASQGFQSLQQAYDAAEDGATIKVQEEVLAEKLVPNSIGKKVYILGGYEPTFTTQVGYTAILGKLAISQGSIVVNRVVVR
jgi:hypothetical protein